MNNNENCCCKEKNKYENEKCLEKHAKKEDCECHCDEKGPCH